MTNSRHDPSNEGNKNLVFNLRHRYLDDPDVNRATDVELLRCYDEFSDVYGGQDEEGQFFCDFLHDWLITPNAAP